MRTLFGRLALALVLVIGCKSGGDDSTEPESSESSAESQQESEGAEETGAAGGEETATAETSAVEEPPPAADGEPFEGVRDGYFVSTRFNVRFQIPADWNAVTDTTEDSMVFEGPDGIQMIVANSQSIQLVDTNFSQLNDRVSFDAVNILPDRSEARPLNGLPGYRVEGDALLRGENLPIYFISQAVNVPGEPVMATIFVPGDNYFEHSDAMRAVLDSIEALELRPN